jgi:hypothetical protein
MNQRSDVASSKMRHLNGELIAAAQGGSVLGVGEMIVLATPLLELAA